MLAPCGLVTGRGWVVGMGLAWDGVRRDGGVGSCSKRVVVFGDWAEGVSRWAESAGQRPVEASAIVWLDRIDCVATEMAKLNEQIAERTAGVSKGCYAANQLATGHGQTRPFLVEQIGDFYPPDQEELFKQFGVVLIPKIKPDGSPEPIQLDSSKLRRL